jgi:hypothetical protein
VWYWFRKIKWSIIDKKIKDLPPSSLPRFSTNKEEIIHNTEEGFGAFTKEEIEFCNNAVRNGKSLDEARKEFRRMKEANQNNSSEIKTKNAVSYHSIRAKGGVPYNAVQTKSTALSHETETTSTVPSDTDNDVSTETSVVSDAMTNEIETTSTVPSETMFVADELTKLKNLLDAGVLTKEEFAQQKAKLLGNKK